MWAKVCRNWGLAVCGFCGKAAPEGEVRGGWGESSLGGELGSKRGGIGGNMSLFGFPVSFICVRGKNCKNCECLLLEMSDIIFKYMPDDSQHC